MGLWLVCNSWSRDHRSAGHIPEDADILKGHETEVAALVGAKLWLKERDGYRFKDWEEWNSDETPKTTAARLVGEVVPPGHPLDVLRRLGNEVAKLLEEGIEYGVVKAALKVWLAKPNASPSWLPMFVSDVIKKGGSGERDAALRDAWKTGDVRQLTRFGLVYVPPAVPLTITSVDECKAFVFADKRRWLEEQSRKAL